jgi:transposase InsO family protein
MNVDLCFVPTEHVSQDKLPAVSGSSGHLVVGKVHDGKESRYWPGQVFADAELDYLESMESYAKMTRERLVRGKIGMQLPEQGPTNWRKEWEARQLRHQVLQERRKEDVEWLVERKVHHKFVEYYRSLTRQRRQEMAEMWEENKAYWAKREAARKLVCSQRKLENQAWHQANRARKGDPEPTTPRTWIAILVVTDNCTRQCLALPVFISGSKLTADEVVEALRTCLPKEMAFLISDQGTHFRSKSLAKLAEEAQFIQIPIYRRRPQTNGIAERFVLTLKQWLESCDWNGADELGNLLKIFRPEYNNRPHQGLAIPGLSPNEFANRIWLM